MAGASADASVGDLAGSTPSSHPHVRSPAAERGAGSGHLIGEAAALVGVSPSALRLWERQGLISPRRRGRYRLFDDADIQQLREVKRLRDVEQLNAAGIRRALGAAVSAPADGGSGGTLGGRLRALRRRRRLSLREAASRTELSVSFISSVERGAAGASVAALQRLTHAYDATLLDLFGAGAGQQRLVRPDERGVLHVGEGVRIEQLSVGSSQMEPQLFVLGADASSDGAYEHVGEEFMFLMSGALEVCLGDTEVYTLAPGDALSFPSTIPHRWRNTAGTETRLLWVNTPPTF